MVAPFQPGIRHTIFSIVCFQLPWVALQSECEVEGLASWLNLWRPSSTCSLDPACHLMQSLEQNCKGDVQKPFLPCESAENKHLWRFPYSQPPWLGWRNDSAWGGNAEIRQQHSMTNLREQLQCGLWHCLAPVQQENSPTGVSINLRGHGQLCGWVNFTKMAQAISLEVHSVSADLCKLVSSCWHTALELAELNCNTSRVESRSWLIAMYVGH